jgi:hypothetical protein
MPHLYCLRFYKQSRDDLKSLEGCALDICNYSFDVGTLASALLVTTVSAISCHQTSTNKNYTKKHEGTGSKKSDTI